MNFEKLLETLKNVLKAQKMTYRSLSEELGMSESGVKKMLSGKDLSLLRLSQICEVLGLSFMELVQLAGKEEIATLRLSQRQEKALMDSPRLLRFFWFLSIEGRSLEEIRKKERLSLPEQERILLQLEKNDFIRRNPRGKIVFSHKGLYRWEEGSPLTELLNHKWSRQLIEKVLSKRPIPGAAFRLTRLKLSKKSQESFIQRWQDLVDEFLRKGQVEKLNARKVEAMECSLLVAFAPSGFLED